MRAALRGTAPLLAFCGFLLVFILPSLLTAVK